MIILFTSKQPLKRGWVPDGAVKPELSLMEAVLFARRGFNDRLQQGLRGERQISLSVNQWKYTDVSLSFVCNKAVHSREETEQKQGSISWFCSDEYRFYNEYFIKLSQIKRSTSSHFVTFPSTLKEALTGRRPAVMKSSVLQYGVVFLLGTGPGCRRAGADRSLVLNCWNVRWMC